MRAVLILAACAVGLSGCAQLGIGGGAGNLDVTKILTDPACTHHDELSGVTGAGGIPASLQFKVTRDCQPVGAVPVAVVAPKAPAAP